MKLYILLIFTTIIVIIKSSTSSSSSSSNEPISYNGWELVFEDEFEGNTLNINNWNPIFQSYDYNAELEIYLPENIVVDNGYLNIMSKKEQYQSHNYTSGKLTSSQRFNTTFGRIEVSAKLPIGKGYWPAIWMMPETDACWPLAGEIDIMESIGIDDLIYGTFHFSEKCGVNGQEGGNVTVPTFNQDFNLYSVIWDENQIIWMVNNVQYFQIKNSDIFPIPSTIPFYIILNTAVGGDWGGYPDEQTVFPQNFTIDYVRAYKQESNI
ncbi:hypothetical protein DICPUDRAFT_149133 [Dictyostelium purpureum]|uniref:GH16 domain-containing protein n=1 Tax=Dictyostelium purpureum TaxID=5786 RepID=F0ZCX9_DICPU|nr:uncharacterized protein DICPUDRAFT_149133 [Dictyostelium purpureum]EGC38216.1 hypothetical protein DICPUDRAFT_149133 [Dictyostelium purpureum]|eukprot:XP_003285254.1 hypothetical protein DICPUDRAFT_149133 [Dictyostelium purpureum]